MRVGALGTTSSKDGLQKIYVDCDKEFYDTHLAIRSFVYSDNERIAFIMSKTADESSHFSALRKMIFEALKSGKVEKKTYRRRKKRQMKKTRRRAKSKTADVVVLEGGRYFSNRAGFRR